MKNRLSSMIESFYNHQKLKPVVDRHFWGKKRGFEALGRK